MSIGSHLIVDFHEVEHEHLVARERITDRLAELLTEAGFRVLGRQGHDFEGGGFTSVVILAESHAALHSYPERGYLAFDFFSCGDRDPMPVLKKLRSHLGDPRCETSRVPRGHLMKNDLEENRR